MSDQIIPSEQAWGKCAKEKLPKMLDLYPYMDIRGHGLKGGGWVSE